MLHTHTHTNPITQPPWLSSIQLHGMLPSFCLSPASLHIRHSLLLSVQNFLLAHSSALTLNVSSWKLPNLPSLPLWAEFGAPALSHRGPQVSPYRCLLPTQSTSINLCLCPSATLSPVHPWPWYLGLSTCQEADALLLRLGTMCGRNLRPPPCSLYLPSLPGTAQVLTNCPPIKAWPHTVCGTDRECWGAQRK